MLKFAVLIFSAFVLSASAIAQMTLPLPCDVHSKTVQMLSDKYGEASKMRGITRQWQVIEVFVSSKKTFTILLVQPSGMSCLLAVGDDWQTESFSAPMRKGGI